MSIDSKNDSIKIDFLGEFLQMIKNKRGITLMSLMIVVIIIFILAGVGLNISFMAIKDVINNKLSGELGILRQAIVERYSMAAAVNQLEVGANKQQVSFWVGDKIQDVSGIELPDSANQNEDTEIFVSNLENYTIEYQEDYYYRLNPNQLDEIGVRNSDYTYIVNYKTGEVYNETKKVDSKNNLLYLPPIKNTEDEKGEDTTSFNDWNK